MEALVKQRAMDYLVQNRAQTLRAPYTVRSGVTAMGIARSLGVPPHDLIHTLWDLQKQDRIRFRERSRASKTGQRGDLDQFQVTAVGLAYWRDVEQVLGAPAVVDLGPGADARVETLHVAADIAGAPRKPNGTNGHDPASVDVPAFLANVRGEPEGGAAAASAVPAPVRATLDPILVGVLSRARARERVREAAQALEAAGLVDQALAVLETITDNDVEQAMAAHLMACPYAIEP